MSQTEINPEGQPAGREGQIIDIGPVTEVASMFNAESSAGLGFGLAVAGDPTDDSGRSALKLATTSDPVAGVLAWGFNHQPGVTGDVGTDGTLNPGAECDVLRKGRILVKVEETVQPFDRGFCRVTADGDEVVGAWRKSSDSSDCIDCTKQTVFRTGASAGQLAVLEVDFTAKP